MVETRSQRKKELVEMATGSQAGSSHDEKDTTIGFIEKVVEKIENMEISWKEELDELRTHNDDLKTQNEYTDLRCA